jgi:hypothetical protein
MPNMGCGNIIEFAGRDTRSCAAQPPRDPWGLVAHVPPTPRSFTPRGVSRRIREVDRPFGSMRCAEINLYDREEHVMIEVEYIDGGRKVIIPVEVWESLKDLAEHAQIYDLIQQRKGRAALSTTWTKSWLKRA